MTKNEEELREALEEVLSLYGIKMDEQMEKLRVENIPEDLPADYGEIVGKTQQKLDELNEKAEQIFQRTGMSRDQLEAYAANPNNFTKEQWEALQKVREACEKYKRQARARIGEEEFEERLEKVPVKKQAHRFAKKKNWIPL